MAPGCRIIKQQKPRRSGTTKCETFCVHLCFNNDKLCIHKPKTLALQRVKMCAQSTIHKCSTCKQGVNLNDLLPLAQKEWALSGRCAACQDEAFSGIYCTECCHLTKHSNRAGCDANVWACELCHTIVAQGPFAFSPSLTCAHKTRRCLMCDSRYVVLKKGNSRSVSVFGPSLCLMAADGEHVN